SWTTETVADFESFRIKGAGRAHLGGHLRTNGNEDRRNAFHFDFTLNRDDRPVTDAWSTAGEDHRVRARALVDFVGDFTSRPFVHRFELHRVSHVADVFLCDATNEAVSLQIAEHVDGKDDIDVFIRV